MTTLDLLEQTAINFRGNWKMSGASPGEVSRMRDYAGLKMLSTFA